MLSYGLPGGGTGQKRLYPPIAIGPDSYPRIVYYDGNAQRGRLLTMSGAGWSEPETIDTTFNTGFYPDLAIDSEGGVHISHFVGTGGANGGLKYAYRDPTTGTWTNQTVDRRENTENGAWMIGDVNAIALMPNGQPRILYRCAFSNVLFPENNFLAITIPTDNTSSYPPDGWWQNTIMDNAVDALDLAIDGSGTHHIVVDSSTIGIYRPLDGRALGVEGGGGHWPQLDT